jgi:hypothetical protein
MVERDWIFLIVRDRVSSSTARVWGFFFLIVRDWMDDGERRGFWETAGIFFFD